MLIITRDTSVYVKQKAAQTVGQFGEESPIMYCGDGFLFSAYCISEELCVCGANKYYGLPANGRGEDVHFYGL